MKADGPGPTPREASVIAEEVLKRLDEQPGQGLAVLRATPPLVGAIVRAYLQDELPEAFRVFNPGLVARVKRVRAKFRVTATGNDDPG
jgi:hypothetical protein